MTSIRQIAANRRNAANSTGPRTDEGKSRSRQNAFRHGLTAETVVTILEQREEYELFEQEIITDYRPTSAIEQQLVVRLASLLWRLRRATLIETGLFERQARILLRRRREAQAKFNHPQLGALYRILGNPHAPLATPSADATPSKDDHANAQNSMTRKTDPALAFLQVCHANSSALERLGRYETMLWRQLAQTLIILEASRKNPRQVLLPKKVSRSIAADRRGSGFAGAIRQPIC